MRKIRLKSPLNARLAEQFQRELNDSQRAAVMAPDGYNLILAGPGSGKTRVITYRVAYLIATRRPGRVDHAGHVHPPGGAGDGAADGNADRPPGEPRSGRARSITSATACSGGPAGLLGYQPNFTILDSEDQLDLIRLAMDDAGLSGTGKLAPKPAAVHHLISFAANVNRPLAQIVAERAPDLVQWLSQIEAAAACYARAQARGQLHGLRRPALSVGPLDPRVSRRARHQGRMFRHILIDEMQDTNAVQVEVVEAIAAAGAGNLTAVGDDAQSIYRFRGANYDNILKFPERHPGARIFQLDVNYRSTPQIVAFTKASIARKTSGFPKELVSRTHGRLPAPGRADRRRLRGSRAHLPADPRSS